MSDRAAFRAIAHNLLALTGFYQLAYTYSNRYPTAAMYVSDSQPSPTETLPTMYDLPSEHPNEPGFPDEYHRWQANLLFATCCPPNYPTNQIFMASDLYLYYDSNHLNWYKRPDWFVVAGISRLYQEWDLRLSYVIWQEKVSPLVMVELLSPGTEEEDLGLTESESNQPPTKWRVYEQILKIPYYIVFNRYNDELRVFSLVGDRYREQNLTESRFWIPELELGIGLWLGVYQGCQRQWLRWYDADGNWILTPEERAEQERIAKESAWEQAEQERIAKESAWEQAEQERIAKESAIQQAEQERIAKESAWEQAEEAWEQAAQERIAKESAWEQAEEAWEQAEQERIAKESAIDRSQRLAEQLRAMGINPDEL